MIWAGNFTLYVPLVQWQVIPQVRVLADIRNLHIDEFDGLVGKRSEKVPKGPKRHCLGRVYILQEPLLRSDSVPVMIQLLHQWTQTRWRSPIDQVLYPSHRCTQMFPDGHRFISFIYSAISVLWVTILQLLVSSFPMGADIPSDTAVIMSTKYAIVGLIMTPTWSVS